MSTITVVLPERVMDRVADGLVELTERIDAIDPDSVAHGFLGGQHGYGGHWNNAVFQMRPYCWCERDDCPWCGGCNCTVIPTIDGRDVTYQEWFDFYTEERRCGASSESINERRQERFEGEQCDYCAGRGVFSTNGAEPGKGAPNFWHKPSGFKVWWYKYIGRGMETVGSPQPGTIAECVASLTCAPCDGSGEAGETHRGSTEGNSAVTEGQAPNAEAKAKSQESEGVKA